MGKKPEISIIIVNYNTFEYTYNCVRSILTETKEVSFEIIVVDNASQNFQKENLLKLSSSIKVILNKRNLGFAKANNIGIANSTASVVLLLNNDTYLLNDGISLTYNRLIQDESIGSIGCKLLNADLSWQRSFYDFPSITLQIKKLFRLNGNRVDPTEQQEVDWLTGAFIMFQKEKLKHFPDKRLNDNFFMYCEDIQWGFNFRKAGLKNIYLPEGMVVHYHGKSSSYESDFKKKLSFYYPNLAKLLIMEYGIFYARTYLLLLIFTFATDTKHNSWNQNIRPLIKICLNLKSK